MKLYFVLLVAASALLACAVAEDDLTQGCKYGGLDFSSLVGKGPGTDGVWKAVEDNEQAQITYWFNICAGVAIGTGTCDLNTAVCSQYYNHGQVYDCVGRIDSAEWKDHKEGAAKGAVVTFSGGNMGRSTVVTYLCDETVETLQIGPAKTGADLVTSFDAKTKLACGRSKAGSGGLSLGSVLLIVIASTFAAYVMFGMGFQIYRKTHGTQVDSIFPNASFWGACWAAEKDGCGFLYRKIFKRGSSGFDQV